MDLVMTAKLSALLARMEVGARDVTLQKFSQEQTVSIQRATQTSTWMDLVMTAKLSALLARTEVGARDVTLQKFSQEQTVSIQRATQTSTSTMGLVKTA